MSESAHLESPGGGKRERNKATNRQAILTAARDVFSELGYGTTTVRDIIRRTGLASGTFYNYFKSKEEVFEALLEDMAARIGPRLKAARASAETVEDLVRESYRTFFAFCLEEKNDYALLHANAGEARVRMSTAEEILIIRELEADLDKAVAAGLLPPIDVGYFTAAVVGIAREIGERLVAGEDRDAEAAAEFATRFALAAIDTLPRVGLSKKDEC